MHARTHVHAHTDAHTQTCATADVAAEKTIRNQHAGLKEGENGVGDPAETTRAASGEPEASTAAVDEGGGSGTRRHFSLQTASTVSERGRRGSSLFTPSPRLLGPPFSFIRVSMETGTSAH